MKCISHAAGNAAKQWTYSHYSCVATYCSYTAQLILLTYIDQRTEYVRYGRYTDLAASWTTSTIYGVLRLERVGVKSPATKTFTRHVA